MMIQSLVLNKKRYLLTRIQIMYDFLLFFSSFRLGLFFSKSLIAFDRGASAVFVAIKSVAWVPTKVMYIIPSH
jgi:hypothetical protein